MAVRGSARGAGPAPLPARTKALTGAKLRAHPGVQEKSALDAPPLEARPHHDRSQDRPEPPKDDRLQTDDSPESLARLSAGSLADRLLFLLARNRKLASREAVLDELTRTVVAIDRPELVQRALLTMGGPIVDIYPLELLARVAMAAPDLVPKVSFEPFVKNRAILEAARFFVEDPIRIDLPIALKMRAFALDGGGYPGYCFAPGAPGEYVLEMAGPGRFPVLMRGDVHKRAVIDRIVLSIAEGPPTSD